jgi:hypothetical protein
MPMLLAHVRRILGRPSAADAAFAAVVVTLTAMAARVWWLSAIVPGQDYPQFLVFVRAVQDMGDPASPFHGTYVTGPWFTPTSLPVHVTSLLSYLCGGSIEAAGKVLLTAQNVGLVAASLYLLKTLGRSRWAVVLLFPVIHSVWTVVGGFAAYATALPLVVLGWALAARWLARPGVRSGIALGACLCATLLWHGIAYAELGLGFAVLWCLWRAPSLRARLLSVVPTVPSLLQYALWTLTQFRSPSDRGSPPSWLTPWEAIDSIVEFVWASVPHAPARALSLAALVGVGLVLGETNLGASGPTARMWRARNPFLIVAVSYLAAYFALPITMNRVEGLSNRFPYVAVLAFVFAWNLPSGRLARGLVVGAVLGFSAWCLGDIAQRFRAFDAETRGASELIDRVGLHETLFHHAPDLGFSPAFGAPGNKPTIELEQFATLRHGGLPNLSFAGYGYTYVRYVDNRNPMPGLIVPPSYGPEMTRFDYLLVRSGQAPQGAGFRLVDSKPGWELYGVCGSRRFPRC